MSRSVLVVDGIRHELFCPRNCLEGDETYYLSHYEYPVIYCKVCDTYWYAPQKGNLGWWKRVSKVLLDGNPPVLDLPNVSSTL